MKKKSLIDLIVLWYYATDEALDEAGLDSFHDKSIVRKRAEGLAEIIKQGSF
jgi:hypothetical protein